MKVTDLIAIFLPALALTDAYSPLPASAPAPAPAPFYANVSSCKLPATRASLTEGFDSRTGFVPSLGSLRGYVIFVDFPDAHATETTTSIKDFFFPAASSWYANASYNQLNFSIKADERRFWRMPNASDTYHFDRGITSEEHRAYIQDALNAVGRDAQFGEFHDVLYVVATRGAPNITFSPEYDAPIRAADGTVFTRSVTVGQDAYIKYGPKLINHETGHAMGLPDLYPYERPPGTTTQWVGGFDLMGWISGASPDYIAWHKWKLGWLKDEQFDCVDAKGTSSHRISSVSVKEGTKAVVVKYNSTLAVVAEARTKQGLNSDACAEGVLVYTVNTGINSGEGPINIFDAKPNSGGCLDDEKNDAPFTTQAGSNVFEMASLGIKITVTGRDGGNFTVTVDKK